MYESTLVHMYSTSQRLLSRHGPKEAIQAAIALEEGLGWAIAGGGWPRYVCMYVRVSCTWGWGGTGVGMCVRGGGVHVGRENV